MGNPAIDDNALFADELPSFTPPQLDVEDPGVEIILEDFQRRSQQYLSEREEVLRKVESALRTQVAAAEESSSSENAELEKLIERVGDQAERMKAELLPQIEATRRFQNDAAASRYPRVRAVAGPLLDRNVHIMKSFLRIMDETYDHLTALRDAAVRRDFEGLAAEALAGVWNDGDDE